jgi:hypothetical protein
MEFLIISSFSEKNAVFASIEFIKRKNVTLNEDIFGETLWKNEVK